MLAAHLPRKLRLILLLLALPFISASQCAVLFSSNNSDDKDEDKDEIIIASSGSFVDAPVQGMSYKSGALGGTTGPAGEFQYEPGEPVQFLIGDIRLGQPVNGKAVVTPLDLVPGGDIDTPAVINIARLLQSLDSERGDKLITLPASLNMQAVTSNTAVAAAIQFLDFNDEDIFVNAASQLVAVLTADYPFTATLVDADTARAHMLESIASAAGNGDE